ncbi:MAG: hypothetical protein Q9225_004707, partial [Loekoesia sp. 1 TL-2023]
MNFKRLMSFSVLCDIGAHSLILQRPAANSPPIANTIESRDKGAVPQSNYICKTPVSSSTNIYRSTTVASWEPEPPPSGFLVEFKYISRIRDLDKFNVWFGLLINMVRLGQNLWNQELPRQVKFPESPNFALVVINSATPPRYQTKSMLWTLQGVFEQYVRRGQYSSAALTTRLDGLPLGFATIKSTLLSPRSDDQQANSLISSSQVGRRGLDIRLDYIPNGAVFTDTGFFRTAIQLLVYAANGDPKTQAPGKTSFYNGDEDYTLQIEPMSPDAPDDMPLGRLIQVLGGLPVKMYEQRTGGRWAELKGLVKFDGVNIGRINIKKGRHIDS